MDPYIYINNKCISKDLCYDIIDIFKQHTTNKAKTLSGVNTQILNAHGVSSIDIRHNDWSKINDLVKNELILNVNNYITNIDRINNQSIYKHFKSQDIVFDNFNIQVYKSNENGHYIYHTDNNIDTNNSTERCITFILYLNNVEEGGETTFYNNIKIKPQGGKLVLFPSTWTYPHCSCPVISNDKYIIVGWLNNLI